MDDQSDLLKRLVEKLTDAGVAFLVVGTIGASYHGYPLNLRPRYGGALG